jgi:hypothetical protein
MPADTLEFDPAGHRYLLNGRRVPSVTEILGIISAPALGRVPPEVLEHARRRGELVHQTINFFNRELLDESSVADELRPYLDAWKAFLHETGAVVIASEQPVYHKALGYAGTPDVILDWNGRTVIPDAKATAVVPATVGPQTAAYAEAWRVMHAPRRRPPERRCIHLLPSGRYQVHKRDDPADLSTFISCLNVFRFLEKAA